MSRFALFSAPSDVTRSRQPPQTHAASAAAARAPPCRRQCRRQCRRLRSAAADGSRSTSEPASAPSPSSQWEDVLTNSLQEEGGWDAGSPHGRACVARASALTDWLAGELGINLQLALQLAMGQCRLEAAAAGGLGESGSSSEGSSSNGSSSNDRSSNGSADSPAVAAKFVFFRRLTSAEPSWAAALARVLADSEAALALPAGDSEAAMRFAAQQLQRLPRRRFEQLRQPYSLPRLFLVRPDVGAALLGQHPAGFSENAAPWLRSRLGWGELELAAAALSPQCSELCRLDEAAAQAALDWLLGPAVGLTREQAARLLAPPGLRLLVSPPAQQAAEAARVQRLAGEWGVGTCLAAALVLCQPELSASRAEATGQLVATLQEEVGMSEEQLLDFVLAGGMDHGAPASPRQLAAATGRLKQLLLVHGSWPAVASSLAAQPDLLTMSGPGVESLLQGPQQRQAWRLAADLAAADWEEQGR